MSDSDKTSKNEERLLETPPLRKCPKCNDEGHVFICSERGCPVNGDAAHD